MSATEPIAVRLTLAEWQTVFAGVAELPFKHAAPIAAKLQQQLAGAQAPSAAPAPPAIEPERR